MRVRLITFAALILAISGRLAAGQENFSDVQIKSTKVAGNVYMLEGRGGNIGVSAGDDGILIVDDQFAPLAEKIRAALKDIHPGKLRFVLNTHWHGDHTGGNVEFGAEAPIIAHSNVRKRLATRQEQFGRPIEPLPSGGLPVITFDDALSAHFNGEEIRVLHLPGGHTDGDSVVFFTRSNVVHMGDLLFAGRFPFVDLQHGGDVEGYIRNVAAVFDRIPPGAMVIPGHGPLSKPEDIRTYLRMLKETTEAVRNLMRDGKTLEEIQAVGLPQEWETWGEGFISESQWIQTIHTSFSRP